jgi:enolase
MKIQRVHAREVLDSRGQPTVEVDVTLKNGARGRATVPSGASTGSHEAVELRDGGKRFLGKGVARAVAHVNERIAPRLRGKEAREQAAIDRIMLDLDGSANKGKLGANAILGVSLAVAHAQAKAQGVSLYRYLGGAGARTLPTPMLNVLNGGVHADNNVDVQEFLIVPLGFTTFSAALRAAAEIFQTLKKVLHDRSLSTAVGDEGGFAPRVGSNAEAIELLLEAIEQAGYHSGAQVAIALDVASSEFYDDGAYVFKKSDGRRRSRDEIVRLYEEWVRQYPIVSIEDGFAEDDWEGWRLLTQALGDRFASRQLDSRQGQSDRHAERDSGDHAVGEGVRLHHGHLAPFGRNRGRDDRRLGRGDQRRPDQNRRALPRRAHGEVQSASQDRRGIGPSRRLCGEERLSCPARALIQRRRGIARSEAAKKKASKKNACEPARLPAGWRGFTPKSRARSRIATPLSFWWR